MGDPAFQQVAALSMAEDIIGAPAHTHILAISLSAIELLHAFMIGTSTDPPRMSSSCRANQSSHPDVSMSALNIHTSDLLCVARSR